MRRHVLIIVSGNPADDKSVTFSQEIQWHAMSVDANVTIVQADSDTGDVLRSPMRYTHIFVLGEAQLAQDTVDLLLNDEWHQNPMRVVAVSETGLGAQLLRHRQLELLGPNFDNGLISEDTLKALPYLLPPAT